MQQSIRHHVQVISQANQQARQRSQELMKANDMVRLASRRKTAFIQVISHHIRTPLNVITGFAQLICAEHDELSEREMKNMTGDMQKNADNLNRIVNRLVVYSLLEHDTAVKCNQQTPCNEVAQAAIAKAEQSGNAKVPLVFNTSVGDDLCITTNRDYLQIIISELLDNAIKFTAHGSITMRVEASQADIG